MKSDTFDDISKIIDSMESPDSEIRNLATNMFLNIRDESLLPAIFNGIQKSGKYVKQAFIRLVTLFQKPKTGHYLIYFFTCDDIDIQNDAVKAVGKIAGTLSQEELDSMLNSENSLEVSTALAISTEASDRPIAEDKIITFLKNARDNNSDNIFINSLKYAVSHKIKTPAAAGAVLNALNIFFHGKRLKLFSVTCRLARYIVPENDLLAVYQSIFGKFNQFDDEIISSLLSFESLDALDFAERIFKNSDISLGLRSACLIKYLNRGARDRDLKKALTGLKLLFSEPGSPLKYIILMELLNFDSSIIHEALKSGLLNLSNQTHALEYFILNDRFLIKEQKYLNHLPQLFASFKNDLIKAMLLNIYSSKKIVPPPEFLNILESTYKTSNSKTYKYFSIILIVTNYELNGGIRKLEKIFTECSGDNFLFSSFAEAYIKKVRETGILNKNFYKNFIERLFAAQDLNLIAAAAVSLPYNECLDFLHDFINLSNESLTPMFKSVINDTVVSLLNKNSEALEFFLDSVTDEKLPVYINILRQTKNFNAFKAFVRKFPLSGRSAAYTMSEPVVFALKEAIYGILTDNVVTIFDIYAVGTAENNIISSSFSPVVMNALEDAFINNGYGTDVSFLYKKTDKAIKFYKQMVQNIGYENKFYLFNLLHKYGGSEANELINAIG